MFENEHFPWTAGRPSRQTLCYFNGDHMDQAANEKPGGVHRFKKGEPRPQNAGRRGGSTNKVPRALKDALILAAELEGSNHQGSGKLIGFLRMLAREDLRAFASLLGRVIPMQIENRSEVSVEVTYRSVDEVRRELESRGISMELVQKIMHQPATVIENEGIEMVEGEDETNRPAA